MTLFYVGTIAEVTLWTCIEPSVGVVCSCLPTLRPLLKELRLKAEHVLATVRCITTSTRQDGSFQLEPGIKNTGKANPGLHTRWPNDIDLTPNNTTSNESTATTSNATPTSDRNDIMFAGINVQRDVRVERKSRNSSGPSFV